MRGRETHGVCKLTGRKGKYVKSHIIPKALTPREIPGGILFQSAPTGTPTKRWDSWYDKNLVIRAGEDVLAEIDDLAIKEIRHHKLAWKHWRDVDELNLVTQHGGPLIGVRILNDVNQLALARLALSILWRAGESHLADLSGFEVRQQTLERARKVLMREVAFNPAEFPIKIFQFGSKGPIHNLTPMNHVLVRPNGVAEPFYRIYADGFFFHVVETEGRIDYDVGSANWFLANQEELGIVCLDWGQSSQSQFADASFQNFLKHRSN